MGAEPDLGSLWVGPSYKGTIKQDNKNYVPMSITTGIRQSARLGQSLFFPLPPSHLLPWFLFFLSLYFFFPVSFHRLFGCGVGGGRAWRWRRRLEGVPGCCRKRGNYTYQTNVVGGRVARPRRHEVIDMANNIKNVIGRSRAWGCNYSVALWTRWGGGGCGGGTWKQAKRGN